MILFWIQKVQSLYHPYVSLFNLSPLFDPSLEMKNMFLIILFSAVPLLPGKPLNEYISHYETLSYNTDTVQTSHRRARRSLTRDPQVYVKFRAHGRPFHIRLRRDLTTFADNLVVDSPHGEIAVDTSHIYTGEVLGEPGSHVFGSIIDGVFTGKIHTERDAYFVEHAKYYFPNGTHRDHGFHSVIYNENHVDDPYAKHRTGKGRVGWWGGVGFICIFTENGVCVSIKLCRP